MQTRPHRLSAILLKIFCVQSCFLLNELRSDSCQGRNVLKPYFMCFRTTVYSSGWSIHILPSPLSSPGRSKFVIFLLPTVHIRRTWLRRPSPHFPSRVIHIKCELIYKGIYLEYGSKLKRQMWEWITEPPRRKQFKSHIYSDINFLFAEPLAT